MVTLYFPGGGFGFWYLFGIYINLRENHQIHNYQILGCSAGSLIGLVSLLKDDFINLDFLINISNQAKEKNPGLLNIYNFINSLFDLTEDYIDYENLSLNLQNLSIHITEIDYFICGCFPYLNKKIIYPENLKHLRQLCLASCQIPFFGRSPHHCCFLTINKRLFLDGMFSEEQLNSNDYQVAFDASSHLSLKFPSLCQIENMYHQGYHLLEQSCPQIIQFR